MSIQTFSKIGEDNYVVVFRSLLSENSKGYPQMAERMKKLVSQQAGFLESFFCERRSFQITVKREAYQGLSSQGLENLPKFKQ